MTDKKIAILTLLFVSCCSFAAFKCGAQTRASAVAGQFYPGDPGELSDAVKKYLDSAPAAGLPGRLICLLVPHAGYEFSAPVAAAGYKTVSGQYDTVVILGTAHTVMVKGAAVYPSGSFETPLGSVPVDRELAAELLKKSPLFENNPLAHLKEHSIEIQLPFLIKRLAPGFKILPIVMNTDDFKTVVEIGGILGNALKGRKVLIVVSSDLSHYPPKDTASAVDRTTLAALERMNPEYFKLTNSMMMNRGEKNLECTYCGEAALIAGLAAAKELGSDRAVLLKYSNSGEVAPATGERAVGYAAMAFVKTGKPMPEPALTDVEKNMLLKTAKNAVSAGLDRVKIESGLSGDPNLNLPAAVFVTLTESGMLRGCIGDTEPRAGLKDSVIYFAQAAAFEDHRFTPVTREELPKLHIEISILSPMKSVPNHESVVPGKTGVVLAQGPRSGLFLPQVWEQIPDKADFLSELCSQKAGLPRDCWKDPKTEIKIFTVYSFEEPR